MARWLIRHTPVSITHLLLLAFAGEWLVSFAVMTGWQWRAVADRCNAISVCLRAGRVTCVFRSTTALCGCCAHLPELHARVLCAQLLECVVECVVRQSHQHQIQALVCKPLCQGLAYACRGQQGTPGHIEIFSPPVRSIAGLLHDCLQAASATEDAERL